MTASGQCSDSIPTFTYAIIDTPVSAGLDNIKLSVDSENNKIWFKGLSGGTLEGVFTITVQAKLPWSTTISTFTFQLIFSRCALQNLIVPTLVNQLYYVRNALGSYTPPAFLT